MKKLLVASALLFMASCSTVKKENLAKVKTVAVVGFTVDQLDGTANKKYMDKISATPYSEELYQVTAKKLKETLGWTVVTKQQIANNPILQSHYKKKDKLLDQLFKTSPLYVGQRRLEAQSVPQMYFVETLTPDEKVAIAKTLKADAIVVLTANAREAMGMLMMSQTEEEFNKTRARENVDVHLSLRVFDGQTGEKITNMDYQSGAFTGTEKTYQGFTGTPVEVKTYKAYDSVLQRALNAMK